jgi:hypothetical protein
MAGSRVTVTAQAIQLRSHVGLIIYDTGSPIMLVNNMPSLNLCIVSFTTERRKSTCKRNKKY